MSCCPGLRSYSMKIQQSREKERVDDEERVGLQLAKVLLLSSEIRHGFAIAN